MSDLVNEVPIIAVTGTKGKSSVVQLISSVFDQLQPGMLRVDTTGAYIGNEQLANVAESMSMFGYGTAISPGKYLLLANRHDGWSHRSVLECSIGCATYGLGYAHHSVGVFTNIFSDHIGKLRPTRADLAEAKSFIASHVQKGGSLVYNADEPLIVAVAERHRQRITLIPVSLTQDATWTADATTIYYEKQPFLDLSALPWLIHPSNTPYVYNALFTAGALHASGVSLDDIKRLLPSASLDRSTGRLEVLGDSTGVRILLTFAHEEGSLHEVVKLARHLAGDSRILGSVRIAHRPTELVRQFAQACVGFDELVVYEKKLTYTSRHPEPMGPILQSAFRNLDRDVEYISDEAEALKSLVAKARPGDVVVHIVNGDTKKSREIALRSLT